MINEKLFSLLENAYGSVKVLRPGVAMNCRYKIDPRSEKTRLEVKQRGQGEEYRLNCPHCDDTRGRLYISHRWGVFDKKTRTRNLWLANCHNENCYNEYKRQKQLYDTVYGSFSMGSTDLRKPDSTAKTVVIQEVELPGSVWPLSDMLKRAPHHHALQYLRDRLISPEDVCEDYKLSYCLETTMRGAENRIIIPMWQGGRMVGWQARYIGEPTDKNIPKYYTGPGTALNLLWYNSDIATTYYTKVIVEGALDVWAVGPQGMAIFNKKIGDERLQTLYKLVNRMEEIGNFVLLLDPDENPKDVARDKGKHQHHMEMVGDLFRKRFPKKVLTVYLPSRTDPGGLDNSYIWALIRKVAEKKNFEISDRRIKRKEGNQRKCARKPNEPRPVSARTAPSGQ